MIKVTGNNAVDAGKKAALLAGDEITIKVGSASITMSQNGDITIEGKDIKIKGSGDIVHKANKISEN
jgi:type VI secretion system secreted protein VgrG